MRFFACVEAVAANASVSLAEPVATKGAMRRSKAISNFALPGAEVLT
jgi:hypothetical protein